MARPSAWLALLLSVSLSVLLAAATDDQYLGYNIEEEGSGEPPLPTPTEAPPPPPLPATDDFETDVSSEEVSKEDLSEEETAVEDVAVDIVRTRLNRTGVLEDTVMEVPAVLPEPPSGPTTLVLKDSDAEDFALTFAGEESFVKVDLPGVALCSDYELKLQFRSDLPNGLIAFLRQVPPTVGSAPRMHQYLYLKNGRLVVRSVVEGERNTFVSQRGGLQDRDWHTVSVYVACGKGSIVLSVDEIDEVFVDHNLERMAASVTGGKSLARLWVGGLPQLESEVERPLVHVKRFRGCMRNVQLLQIPKNSLADDFTFLGPTPVPMNVVGQNDVISRITCVDKCLDSKPCSEGSVCINHFSHATCDCSQLQTLGPKCDKEDKSFLVFNGDGYLEHKLYTWQNRAQKRHHRLTFQFKTNTSDAVLFFARSLHPSKQYVTLSLDSAGRLNVSGTFEDFEENVVIKVDGVPSSLTTTDTPSLMDNDWHHVIMNYFSEEAAAVHLDPDVYFGYAPDFNQACQQPRITGDLECRSKDSEQSGMKYYFDPHQATCLEMEYSGCGGNQNRFSSSEECLAACYVPGLASYQPFIGSLKKVFVDGINLLDDLKNNQGQATRYTGQQPKKKKGAHTGQVLSLTTPRSSVPLPTSITEPQNSLSFELELRVKGEGNASVGVLAQGAVMMSGTVDRWMVHSDGHHLYFRLQNDLINVQSPTKIKSKEWNKVSVSASATTITLSLNGDKKTEPSPITVQYLSGVTLGGDRGALQGCIKNVRLDGGPALDLRQFINRDRGVQFDGCKVHGPCELMGCQHGGVCSLTATNDVKCDCSDTGYEGNRCQFARYPISCEGYRRHGFSVSGRYRVDLDGEGPNPPSVVQCDFTESGTSTEIQHNIPQGFVVRKKGFNNHQVKVNYEDLSNGQLETLVSDSTSCSQTVTFDCTRARLKLSSETWFTSPKMKLNSFFGTDVPGICPCKAVDQCDKPNVPCNCDINDGIARRDSAVITEKRQLPVTGLYFIMDEETTVKRTKAALTLGSLVCYKEDTPEDSVSLLDSEGFLEFSSSNSPGRLASVGFAFRTSATEGTLLHKPSFHPMQPDYRLLLKSSNTLEFQYQDEAVTKRTTFHTSYSLNVADWQYVWLDFSDKEIKVVLNGHTKFINFDKEGVMEGDFYLGGSPSDVQGALYQAPSLPGLIGCLKDLTLNTEPLSLKKMLQRAPTQHFNLGCQLSCDPSPCSNDAVCVEQARGKYECQCRNPYAESGKNCEKNLNSNSITLLNADTEMRLFNEEDVEDQVNPLKEDVTFSFRTRELQGLLVFAKDHIQNLLQIHLSKPNEVSMIWNTGDKLRKMTINTGDLELNKGFPVQLFLTRSRTATELHLLTRDQFFRADEEVGVELLEEKQYQQFPFGSLVPDPELTLYPQPRSLPRPSLKVRIGAAASGGLRGKVPGFVGCISGLKVGSRQLDLKDTQTWKWNQNTYELGCYSACSNGQSCLNGGQCMDVFHRGTEVTSQCDCASTSYRGDRCNQETAYSFSGKDSLVFRNRYGVFASPFAADFAFALTDEDPEHSLIEGETQALMILRDIPARPEDYARLEGPGDLLAVGLLGQSQLVMVARLSVLDAVNLRTLKVDLKDVNITDGYRYHVHITVGDKEINVQINGAEFVIETKLSPLPESTSTPVESLVVGGTGGLDPTGFPVDSWTNFRGCVSNIQFRTVDRKVFLPLQDYDTHLDDTASFQRQGLPNRTTCSRFQPRNLKAVVHNHAAYQAKTLPLPPAEGGPKRQSFKAMEQQVEEETGGVSINTAGKVAAVFMCGVMIAVGIYLCKINNKYKKRKEEYKLVNITDQAKEEEQQPQEQEMVHICSKGKGGRKGSSSESDESLSLENSTELIAQKRPPSGEVEAAPCELKYVKETPEDTTSKKPQDDTTSKGPQDDKEDEQDQPAKDVDEEDGLQQEKKSGETEDNLHQEKELTAPVVTVEVSSQDQTNQSQVEEEPSQESSERPNDMLSMAGNNELEKSCTKLSESHEDIVQPKDKDSSSSSSSSSSNSGSTSSENAVAQGLEATEEEPQKKLKKKRKKKAKRSGSYVLHDSDDKPSEAPSPQPAPEEDAAEPDPETVSAANPANLPPAEDVEAVTAQSYYLARQPSKSPKLPPKKGAQ